MFHALAGSGVRYLTPLCPFLAWALFTSLSHFSKLAAPVLPKAVRPAAFVVAPVVALILLQQSLVYYQAHTRWIDEVVYDVRGGTKARHLAFGYFESERNLNAGLDWLMERAGPAEVIAASVPGWVYLRTGHKAVMPPFEVQPETAQRQLDSVPVTYLFLEEGNFTINGRSNSQYVSSVIQRYPDLWEPVYSTPSGKFKIFRRSGCGIGSWSSASESGRFEGQ
jgi:hypothetical protein